MLLRTCQQSSCPVLYVGLLRRHKTHPQNSRKYQNGGACSGKFPATSAQNALRTHTSGTLSAIFSAFKRFGTVRRLPTRAARSSESKFAKHWHSNSEKRAPSERGASHTSRIVTASNCLPLSGVLNGPGNESNRKLTAHRIRRQPAICFGSGFRRWSRDSIASTVLHRATLWHASPCGLVLSMH